MKSGFLTFQMELKNIICQIYELMWLRQDVDQMKLTFIYKILNHLNSRTVSVILVGPSMVYSFVMSSLKQYGINVYNFKNCLFLVEVFSFKTTCAFPQHIYIYRSSEFNPF